MALEHPHELLIQRLRSLGALDGEEQEAVRALPARVRDFAENSDLVRQGERPVECCMVLRGLVCRYKMVAGGRRQILAIHFTGDLPDLQSLHLAVMDHGISALTVARAAFFPHDAIRQLGRRHPNVYELLMKQALIDASLFRDWIANIGRRTAYQRIAHLFCEVFMRMRKLGLAEEDSFRLPMTQAELADATALSTVHVNRVLQQLRRERLIVSSGDVHAIADWDGLRHAGDFEESYLHHD
ncbi:MAG TPA: Crp/Fnr family transcriptional regulator [Vitreimonas sp.]|uniref:Crp/Fnr family transcriptional regulator n=1 Tax=Vitreimonas sp. TaxID=3069702 RepID=UPI002D380BAF|nr:Crp/Fnr family transcriptional regulator [Vitreimonas sp.]HYD86936.1 Crp/Fnr family transcriptional regulator [Vitreimonas sp.]